MHRFVIAAFVALSTSLSFPAHATEELTPEPAHRYRVVDVKEGDVLNMRAQPGSSSEIVGALEPDATDIVVAGTRMELNGSVWWQVAGDDGLGWVNARYLARVDEDAFTGEQEFPLRCTGTEPFWSVRVNDGEAVFEAPMEEPRTWQAGPMTTASGFIGRHAIRLESEDGVGYVTAWRNRNFCSDGMSDIGFPYESIVVSPDGTVFAGCCLRAGE